MDDTSYHEGGGGGVSAPAATTAQAAPCHVGGIGIHEGFRWVGAEQP